MSAVTQFPIVTTLGLVWALPFAGLLLSIALLPTVAAGHWLRRHGEWTAFWALALLVPAAIIRGAAPTGAMLGMTALHVYLPFILLLGALYIVTGGIHIAGTPRGGAGVNTALLALGTVLAGIVGTMGAALLLVRPLIRINRHRRRRAHLFVFFIVLVGNVGGALSPLGNPPLLLGYLAGVPFLWPLQHLWAPTLVLSAGLLATFYVLDRSFQGGAGPETVATLHLSGLVNLPLLAALIATVVLAPEYVADALYVAIAGLSLWLTPAAARRGNQFAWAPIAEIAILFAGIFITLIPVLGLIATGTHGPAAPLVTALMRGGAPNNLLFYGATGILSGFLDNAPTYLLFFDFAGGDAARLTGTLASTLAAISAGAMYFGALSYIGNAPNLMVKSLAEASGVRMPGFFAYTGLACLIAGPWYVLVAVLFFR
ncbi:MAG TPA: sodium:proton antiporter [Rhizomicrobium sp.]|jgi:Na+/H+ antiporter NhaD/arsenite permease-like protein|nr:sodium:proton antiporter [Rhizomicrobium sp.]